MKRLAILAALLSAPLAWGQCSGCPTVAGGLVTQAPATTDVQYKWYAEPKDPNVCRLYRVTPGNWEYVGSLDPEAASWRWTPDGKPHDLLKMMGKSRDPGRSTGALPAEKSSAPKAVIPAEKSKERTNSPGAVETSPPAKPKAAIEESSSRSVQAGPEKPVITIKPKAGIEESSDKHPDCKCGDGCKCKDGHVDPDCKCFGCRCADVAKVDVIDGSPRGAKDFRLGGVDESKLTGVPRYAIGGREVGAAEAMSALGAPNSGGTIPDDAGLVRLTVIGGQSVCDRVQKDLDNSPELAYWRGRLVVNCYRPDHWRITSGGFVTPTDPGQPSIYVQAADGKVLWRQAVYGGPSELARALRDKVPGYDPSKDPNPMAPLSGPGPPGVSWYWWLSVPAALAIVAFGLVVSAGVFFWRRKQHG